MEGPPVLAASLDRIKDGQRRDDALSVVKRDVESFDKVGSEQIDGTQTTQYRITVNTQKVLAKTLGDDTLPTGPLAGDLPKTITYDIWVGDQDNLPRRIEYSMGGSSMTMELSDWGQPVDIKAPPPSQISKQDPFSGSLTPQA